MKSKIIFTTVLLLCAILTCYASPGEEGKTIFMSRCAGCHNVNKIVTGPALAGIDNRRPIDWIVKFVRSSQSVVKSGDPYAVSLFEKFNKIPMPDHPDLNEDNIKNIVEYIKSAASVAEPKTTIPTRRTALVINEPLSSKDYMILIVYFVAVLMLIVALLAAVHVKDLQRKLN